MKRTDLEQRLLDVVLASEKPLSRREIAARLPNKQASVLNHYDVMQLEKLVNEGVIVAQRVQVGAVKHRWEYSAP